MRVSIIGAARKRNGIGEYLGKYFHRNGAEVVSVLGTTEDSSRKASISLRSYGIDACPYTDLTAMVEQEKPDALVIASPSSTHHDYLVRGVEMGLNLFCEKPFLWRDDGDPGKMAEEVLGKARERKLTVAMNSQWPFAMEFYEGLCGKVDRASVKTFFMLLSPLPSGKEMIPESVPHALSLLYATLGEGDLLDLGFTSGGAQDMTITFKYASGKQPCDGVIRLIQQKDPPRDFQFGFNDRIVKRSIDPGNYEIYFHYEGRSIKITDPLELSVKDFIRAATTKGEPSIGAPHILNNTCLLKKIFDGFAAAARAYRPRA